jgi:hypothetical protein
VVADCNSKRFDWNALNTDAKEKLKQRTERLCGLFTAITSNKIQIGDELRFIKDQLRGRFTDFVKRELPFSMKTAQRLMRLSQLAEYDKSDTVSLLPYSAALILARKSTSPEIVKQILARARSGDIVSECDVEKMISDEREKLRLAQREAEGAARSAARKSEKEKAAAERAVRRAEKKQKQEKDQAQAQCIIDRLAIDDVRFLANTLTYEVLDEFLRLVGDVGVA